MITKVLYVEDEPSLAQIVSESLVSRGFDVKVATDGLLALDIILKETFDICVLDIMLPNIDGYSLAEKIVEKHPHTPIIFLTAKTQPRDVIKGFDSGGRDYLRKPFSMEELIVRIKNLLSHSSPQPTEPRQYQLGSWIYYPSSYELSRNSITHPLSERESRILHMLCKHSNDTCSRKDILMEIWGDDSFYNSRNLDVYINKLRKLFSTEKSIEIMTLKGVGYIFKIRN
ncbi:MAG: response regulator transcription factor [Saprospiraceae bacterium]